MSPPLYIKVSRLVFLISLATLFHFSHADVGSATQYRPPYLPTACYGDDASKFPSDNMFAAAGDGIWDNGASCGRQYMVRCISSAMPRGCNPSQTIQVRILDYALSSVSPPSAQGATFVLSTTAFAAIANSSARIVNVEYQQF